MKLSLEAFLRELMVLSVPSEVIYINRCQVGSWDVRVDRLIPGMVYVLEVTNTEKPFRVYGQDMGGCVLKYYEEIGNARSSGS